MALIALGVLIGILASVSGLGGGFLAVPVLIYLGKNVKMAVGTSFLFILLVAVSSLASHWRLGNVDLKMGLLLAAGGVLGAQVGPLLLQYVSEQNFKRAFALFLAVTAVWLFLNSKG